MQWEKGVGKVRRNSEDAGSAEDIGWEEREDPNEIASMWAKTAKTQKWTILLGCSGLNGVWSQIILFYFFQLLVHISDSVFSERN